MSPKMIIVSFNVRGVGHSKKLLSLKNILQNINSNVFLIQEMKCYGIKARSILELWLKNWSFCSIDVEGQTGGILSRWSPVCKDLSSKMFFSTILIKLLVKDFGFPF
jgi:exonuclease III